MEKNYRYYEIKVDAGTCITGRIVRTDKGIEAIKDYVSHDETNCKNWLARLLDYKEVTKEKYNDFISLFVPEDRENVIKGTTI